MALRELLAKFDVKVTGGAALTETLAKMGVGEKTAKALGTSFNALKSALPVAALSFGVKKLGEWVYGATQAADQTGELAEQLGFSAKGLQEWAIFAQMSGGRAQDFTKITAKLGDTITAALAGAGPQRKLLQELGIAYADGAGHARDLEEVLLDAAVAIGNVQNPTEKLTLANDLLGKGGRKLATSFKGTREEMRATLAAMGDLGGVYSDTFVKASQEANDELEATERQMGVLRAEIVIAILPAFRWLVQTFGNIARSVRTFLKETHVLDRWLKLLPALISGAGLAGFVKFFPQIAGWLGRVIRLIAPFARIVLPFVAMALVIDDLITLFEGGESAIGKLLDRMFGAGTAADLVWILKVAWDAVAFGVEQLIEDVGGLWDKLGGLTGIATSIKDAFLAVFSWFAEFLTTGPIERVQMLIGLLKSAASIVSSVWDAIGSVGDGVQNALKGLADLKMDQANPATPMLGGKPYAPSTAGSANVNAPTNVTVNLSGKQTPETVRTATSEANKIANGGRTKANALVRGKT